MIGTWCEDENCSAKSNDRLPKVTVGLHDTSHLKQIWVGARICKVAQVEKVSHDT